MNPPADRRLVAITALCAVPLAFGGLALLMGQDGSWDLRNYHYYIADAWLNGRLAVDVAPAYNNSFHNPTLDLTTYWGIRFLRPKLFGFLLGSLQGLNFVFLFLIGRLLPWSNSRRAQDIWAGGLAAVGSLGSGALGELGMTFGDNVVSIPMLAGLYLYLRRTSQRTFAQLVAVGLLVGLAAGLKLTALIYVIGIGCAACLCASCGQRRIVEVAGFSVGSGVGFLFGAGYWCQFLWHTYGNPFFPYWNNVFRSAFANPWAYRDLRYVPQTFSSWIATPFFSAIAPLRISEVPFFDVRLPVVFALGGLYIVARFISCSSALGPTARSLLTVYLASAVVWITSFSIYRYAIPLEMLAPNCIAVLISGFKISPRRRLAIALAGLVLCGCTARPGNWRRLPWSRNAFGITLPSGAALDGALVLVSGTWPVAYIAAALPRTTPMLRIEPTGDPVRNPDFPGPPAIPTQLDQRVRERIARHWGPIYLLIRTTGRADYALADHGLRRRSEPCLEFKPEIEDIPLRLCEVERTPS